jgi:tRNA(Ile)-lysidine synthase
MQLLARVRRTIRDYALADRESRIVAAVSGGSDSTALLHMLRALDRAGELKLVAVAHFNHQLRASSDDDERFVAAMAASSNLPTISGREDIASRARREHRSIEDAARRSRHSFFARAAADASADAVAVGHTRDDQAETFLLRLLRGAGPRGLAAIHPRNGAIIRPLIGCRRSELRAWLAERGISYVDDESNEDVSIPRNRVRAELLPLLERRFNPAIVDVLGDEAELAREAWQLIDDAADRLERAAVKATGSTVSIDLDALGGAPAALRRAVIWRAMEAASGGRPVSFEHTAAVLRMLEADSAPSFDAPGQRVERVGRALVLKGRPPGMRGRQAKSYGFDNLFRFPLSIPGAVRLTDIGCTVSSAPQAAADSLMDPQAAAGRGLRAVVRQDLFAGGLAVRNRRPGDSFRPAGLGRRKKLQDFFVDRKVRRADRDRVPIVVDAADRIVWVAGYGIDEAFRVTDPRQPVLTLELSPCETRADGASSGSRHE